MIMIKIIWKMVVLFLVNVFEAIGKALQTFSFKK